VLPLPPWLDVLRPVFLVSRLYWSVNAPRTGDIALGSSRPRARCLSGTGAGQHALALTLVT